MHLGLSIEIQEGMSYADTLAMSLAGERLGFQAALLAEHYYPTGRTELYAGGLGSRASADAWVYLAALARETQRIRLGTLVSPVTFRHPAVLAKLAATLDHVSDGRAELGVGAGWFEPEHSAYGFEFPPPPRRVDLLEEQLQVITGLWTEDPFSHDGQRYHLRESHFTPRPVQVPRPTLIVGGSTTAKRMPRLAARYADEYVISFASPDQCRELRGRLDELCAQRGREPGAVALSMFTALCVGENEREVERRFETLRTSNPQYVRMLDNQAGWIMGTPDRALEQLNGLAEAGVARVLLSVNGDLHREMLPLLSSAPAQLSRS